MCFPYHNAASLFPHSSPREWAEVTFLKEVEAYLSIPATIKILVTNVLPAKITASNCSSLRLECNFLPTT